MNVKDVALLHNSWVRRLAMKGGVKGGIELCNKAVWLYQSRTIFLQKNQGAIRDAFL